MGVDCGHGSFSPATPCRDCREIRIEALLERIANEFEELNRTNNRLVALEDWRHGHGKHPDD